MSKKKRMSVEDLTRELGAMHTTLSEEIGDDVREVKGGSAELKELQRLAMMIARDTSDMAVRLYSSIRLAESREQLEAIHHPGEDKKGHPVSECVSRGCKSE